MRGGAEEVADAQRYPAREVSRGGGIRCTEVSRGGGMRRAGGRYIRRAEVSDARRGYQTRGEISDARRGIPRGRYPAREVSDARRYPAGEVSDARRGSRRAEVSDARS